MKTSFILFYVFLLGSFAFCQKPLEKTINSIIKNKKATVGVAVIYDGRDTLTVNNNYHYPTMSVFKFHQSLAVLDYMDKNLLPLETPLFLKKSDLRPNTYSPLRDERPEGNFSISIGELVKYTVAKSDNNTSNALFHYMSGTRMTDLYIRTLGIKDFAITATEAEMSDDFNNQYLNWTTPLAAARLLEVFLKDDLVSKDTRDFLVNAMVQTTTGPDKLKALLPATTKIGHKTGSSARSKEGLKVADNDIGFVVLPNGKQYSIAVFVMNSMESDKTNARIIADISKAVYDFYKNK
ncbi:class A beta-lactamase, subclass A2 [Apibacter sp. HY039]|uniref:class A beta-lactamase, subclass A2 n=1 Tax=Apibacter sp. HY039 TaxID=2501476 RepID=UPI000FEBEBB0|nr:class A beta-lactamase, subclass A2 [Apibacter sp. HY039]